MIHAGKKKMPFCSMESNPNSNLSQVDEIMNVNNNPNGATIQSRLIKEAAVTFFRDCNQRGKAKWLISLETNDEAEEEEEVFLNKAYSDDSSRCFGRRWNGPSQRWTHLFGIRGSLIKRKWMRHHLCWQLWSTDLVFLCFFFCKQYFSLPYIIGRFSNETICKKKTYLSF